MSIPGAAPICTSQIAIIGAGASGLVAAKEALEAGFEPTVFEKNDSLGGLWGPCGNIWKTLTTNLTSHSCCFSDFPWSAGTPIYVRTAEMGDYLRRYAEHFGLITHIHFNTEVIRTEKKGDKWDIIYCTPEGTRTMHVSYLIIASGFFEAPANAPQYETEAVRHSSAYRRSDEYAGLEVGIIGGAFSGCEIATELAKTAKKVHLVVRTPHWVLPRFIPTAIDGMTVNMPLDFTFYRRCIRKTSEEVLFRTSTERIEINRYFATLTPRIGPDPGDSPSKVAISDGFWPAVKEGKIALHSSNEGFRFDAVIEATGYRTVVSFLDETTKAAIGYDPEDRWQPFLLYKGTLTPQEPNLAFVGMYRGPYFATIELQARLAMAAFKRTLNTDAVITGIAAEHSLRESNPRAQFPHGDYVGFTDDIAKVLFVFPEVSHPTVAPYAEWLTQGPVVPAHYRLVGPGAKPAIALPAIQAVNDAYRSYAYPTQAAANGAASAVGFI